MKLMLNCGCYSEENHQGSDRDSAVAPANIVLRKEDTGSNFFVGISVEKNAARPIH